MRQNTRYRTGATTVEFALVAPLLFMFIIVGIEFGRANMIRGTLGNAAYEGARAAITPGATAEDAELAAFDLLDATMVNGAKVDVSPKTITDETPEVTVAIEVMLDENSWIAGMFTDGLKITNTRTLQREEDSPDIMADFSPGATGGGTTPSDPSGGGSGSGYGGPGGWGSGWGGRGGRGGGWGGGRGGGRGGRGR